MMRNATSPEDWKKHFALSGESSKTLLNISGVEKEIGSRLPYILRFIPLGSKVLEAGCGRGEYVFSLNLRGYEAHGLDFVQDLIDHAKQFAIESGMCPPERFWQGDVRKLPYENGSFDAYVSMGVIEHFSPAEQIPILSEAHRILRPGGILFVTVPNNLFPWYLTTKLRTWFGHRRLAPMRYVSIRSLKKLAWECDFQLVDIFRYSAEAALLGGLLLDAKIVRGIPNPFHLFHAPLLRLARWLDRRERVPFLGVHTLMIARKA